MTAVNRATLYTYFETGDKPTQAQFQNLIDSSLNVAETSAQTVASSVTFNAAVSAAANLSVATNKFIVSADSGNAAMAGNFAVNTNKFIVSASNGNTTVAGTLGVTGAITPSSTNGIVGTTTNDSANAGSVGELITSNVAAGAAVSLVSTTPKNITFIALTPGDYNVWGSVAYVAAGGTTTAAYAGFISTVTNSPLPADANGGAYAIFPAGGAGTGITPLFPVGTIRITVAISANAYLIGYGNFSGSTATAYGVISARRVR